MNMRAYIIFYLVRKLFLKNAHDDKVKCIIDMQNIIRVCCVYIMCSTLSFKIHYTKYKINHYHNS